MRHTPQATQRLAQRPNRDSRVVKVDELPAERTDWELEAKRGAEALLDDLQQQCCVTFAPVRWVHEDVLDLA